MTDKNKNSSKKEIPKVIELNPSSVVGTLEELLRMAKAGGIDAFIFAGFTPENFTVSSQAELDVIGQQHLVSFLQAQTTLRTVTESIILSVDDIFNDDDDNDDDD